MSRTDAILVFDLDGTILDVNSFPRWALSMVACNVGGIAPLRRLRLSLAAQRLLLLRKLGSSGHDALLAGLQAAWQHACGDAAGVAAERFAARLVRRVRPGLRPVLDRVARGEADAVLATASAEDYAFAVGRALGFRHILATPTRRANGEGLNSGMRKRERVLDYIAARGWSGRRIIFFTDHLDDLPLIQASDAVCWFGSGTGLREARLQAVGVAVMPCESLDTAAMLLAFGSGRASATRAQPTSARASTVR
jgi:phosphoserine phosphatase